MKKLNLTNIVAGVRKLLAQKATLEHIQEGYVETIAELIKGLTANAGGVTVLHGCVDSGVAPDVNISAGAVYYNGEVYQVPAFAGTPGGGQVAVLSLATAYRAGDPVIYSDGNSFNTHEIRTLTFGFAASGSGIVDLLGLVKLKDRINITLLGVPTQIAAIVDAAPGALDTLNELAAALGDDANFASTVTTALAGKVAKAGDVMTGSLEVQGGIRTMNSGSYLKKKVVEIVDWNMDTTVVKNVAHGVDYKKIRAVNVIIRNDADDIYDTLERTSGGIPVGTVETIGSANILLSREAGLYFDSASYVTTGGYVRGWITIEYEV